MLALFELNVLQTLMQAVTYYNDAAMATFRHKGSHICLKQWHVLPFEAHHQLRCLNHYTCGFYTLLAQSCHVLEQKWSSIYVAGVFLRFRG